MAGDHGLPESVVVSTIEKMQAEAMDWNTEALIFGVDSGGPNICHVIEPGRPIRAGRTGLHSIGIGSRLFDAACTVPPVSYGAGWPLVNALLMAFVAKRHAQMAPGVGEFTDAVIVRQEGHRVLAGDTITIVSHRAGQMMAERGIALQHTHAPQAANELTGRL